MAQYKGKVSKTFASRWGGSFGLEEHPGVYFNTHDALPAFVVGGAFVEFEAAPGRTEKSRQVTDSSLKAVAGPPPTGERGHQGQFGSRDEHIRYQSARKDALAMAGLLAAAGALYNEKTPKSKILGILEDVVDRFTAVYFEDIETLGALSRSEIPPQEEQRDEKLPE